MPKFIDLDKYPYLKRVKRLRYDYPALKSFLDKLLNTGDEGRILVEKEFNRRYGRTPGRCCVLEYGDTEVKTRVFDSAGDVRDYLLQAPTSLHSQRRLFVLEDLELEYVEVLGHFLGVDPLVFAEQMNTWNYCDVNSIAHRPLPSLTKPQKSYTTRYYELRTLPDDKGLNVLGCYMTFAVNRRLYQPWRDIDGPSIKSDRRVGFIRRCYSFWTSATSDKDTTWNSLLLVDPPVDSVPTDVSSTSNRNSALLQNPQEHFILQDPRIYRSRSELWNSKVGGRGHYLEAAPHSSSPYHGGVPAAAPLSLESPAQLLIAERRESSRYRNRSSIFDEVLFSWTNIADHSLIRATHEHPVNATYFMTKYVSYHWINLLELIPFTLAQCEYFADDNEARVDSRLSAHEWKMQLRKVTDSAKDFNYFRRQMAHFENVLNLNLERLGVSLDQPQDPKLLPATLGDVQKDFLTIAPRLRSYRERVDNLSGIPDQLASIHAAFKGIEDGALGLRLSVFAAVVFPITLVATVLSMGDDFLPGKSKFWVFFVTSIPLSLVSGGFLRYGEPFIKLFSRRDRVEMREQKVKPDEEIRQGV